MAGFGDRLAAAALECTKFQIVYDPAYVTLNYLGVDIPADLGVCSDVVVHCYRAVGFDLQKLVHEDMRGVVFEIPKALGLEMT